MRSNKQVYQNVVKLAVLAVLGIQLGACISKQEKVQQLFEKAKQCHIHNQLENSVQTFRKLLTIEPDHQDARVMLGLVYYQQSKLDLAEGEWSALARAHPENKRVHGFLSSLYVREGNLDQALEEAQKDLALDPNSDVRTNVARIYLSRKEPGNAEAALKEHMRYWPRDPEAYFQLGRTYAQKSQLPQAIASYEKAFEIDSHYYQSMLEAGALLEKHRRYSDAVALYKKIQTRINNVTIENALKNAQEKLAHAS